MNENRLMARRAARIDRRSATLTVAVMSALLVATGCTSVTMPINGIPAERLPPQLFAVPKNNLVPIDISMLMLEPPQAYQLGPGDILGIYIEGVLPFNLPDAAPQLPPVHFPDAGSLLPPSIGLPIAVQEDGTLGLPLIEPLLVQGLTLAQTREAIREAYLTGGLLRPERAQPIVTLIRERTYNVVVIREDVGGGGGGEFLRGSDRSGAGSVVKLPAYQNDILHALVQTGGLPGLNARNEVKVLRANDADRHLRAAFLQHFYAHQAALAADPCSCPPHLPEDPAVLRIPLRLPPGVIPSLTPEQITLRDGDIVYIEARDADVFYTGGLLPGGEHPLPRDYDLDILGAMAIAGTGIAQGGGGGRGASVVGGVPPGKLYILRKTDCNNQVAIEVDLVKAINDPRARPLVQAGDTLILQYKCEEELINFGLGTFFTYGISQLFRGDN